MGNAPHNCSLNIFFSSCRMPHLHLSTQNTIHIDNSSKFRLPKESPIHKTQSTNISKVTLTNVSTSLQNQSTFSPLMECRSIISKNQFQISNLKQKHSFKSKKDFFSSDQQSTTFISQLQAKRPTIKSNISQNSSNYNYKQQHNGKQQRANITTSFTHDEQLKTNNNIFNTIDDDYEKECSLNQIITSFKNAYNKLPHNGKVIIKQETVCDGTSSGIEDNNLVLNQIVEINTSLTTKQIKFIKDILIKEKMLPSQLETTAMNVVTSIIKYQKVNKNIILFNSANSDDNVLYIIEKGKLKYELDSNNYYLKKGNLIGTKALKKHSRKSYELLTMSKSYLFYFSISKYKAIVYDYIKKEKENIFTLLKQNHLLSCIDNKSLQTLSLNVRRNEYKETKIILNSGDMPSDMYLIIKGSVLCVKQEKIKHTLNANELVGDVCLLSNISSQFTFISNPGTEVLIIPYVELLSVLGSKPIDTLMFNVFNSALDKCEYLKTNLSGDRLKTVFNCFKLDYIQEGFVSSFKMKKIFIPISGILKRKQLTKEEIIKEIAKSNRKSYKCLTKDYTNMNEYRKKLLTKIKSLSNEHKSNNNNSGVEDNEKDKIMFNQKVPLKLSTLINNSNSNNNSNSKDKNCHSSNSNSKDKISSNKILPEIEYNIKGELDINSIISIKDDKTCVISEGCVVLQAFWENIINNISPLSDGKIPKRYVCPISKRITLLKSISKCKHFNDLKLFQLADLLKSETFKENSIILKNGPFSNKVYIIYSGEVKIKMSNTNIEVRTLSDKMHFGEISHEYLEQNTNTATHFDFIASTQVECLTFDRDTYIDIRDKYNNPFENLIQIKDKSITLNKLYYINELGYGTYGKVYLVHNEKEFFALKTADIQAFCGSTNTLNYYLNEKRIMLNMNYQFIVNLVNTFKTSEFIFFLIEYIDGITLRAYINNRLKHISLRNQNEMQFYGSILFLTLNYLQKKRILHRDLKPENIMIDTSGYLKIIDFGVAKDLSGKDSTQTLIGTPHYMAPEIILGKNYVFSSDYWSIGIILYELFYGNVPFGMNVNDTKQIYAEITEKKIVFPSDPKNEDVNKLIKHLLNKHPSQRICSLSEIKEHKVFKDIDFDSISKKEITPKFIPEKKVNDDLLLNKKRRFYQSVISQLYVSGIEINSDLYNLSKITIEDYKKDYLSDF